jgi:hypothetical protein
VANTYFSIVQTQRIVPLNLPSVLLHILNRKEQQEEEEEVESRKENSQKFLLQTFTLKTVFWLLPTAYPLGKVFINTGHLRKNGAIGLHLFSKEMIENHRFKY